MTTADPDALDRYKHPSLRPRALSSLLDEDVLGEKPFMTECETLLERIRRRKRDD